MGSLHENRRHNLEVLKSLFGRNRPPNIEGLAQRGDVDGLARILRYEDVPLRSRAVAALIDFGESAVPSLAAALENDDEAARLAAQALSRVEPSGLAALIARIPRRPASEGGSTWADFAIRSLGDRRPSLAAILRGLRHLEEPVRRWADRLASDFQHLDPDKALIDALEDNDAHVRQYAAWVLVAAGDDRGVDVLILALSRENPPGVRGDTARALWKFKGIEDLISLLKERRDVEGLEAILCHMSGLTEEVRRSLKDRRFDPHYAAAEVLRDLGEPRAADAFIEVVSSQSFLHRYDPSTVSIAAEALGALRDPRAIEPLKWMLLGSNVPPWLAIKVVEALRDIGGPDAAGALVEVLAVEESRWGRIRAVLALDKVIDREMAPTLADAVPVIIAILRDPAALNIVGELDADERWQEESVRASQKRAWDAVVNLLVMFGDAAVDPMTALLKEQPPAPDPALHAYQVAGGHDFVLARAREVLDRIGRTRPRS